MDDHIDGFRPFLAQVWAGAYQDPRQRFGLYASRESLQQVLYQFEAIVPVHQDPHIDSRVLQVERVELTRF